MYSYELILCLQGCSNCTDLKDKMLGNTISLPQNDGEITLNAFLKDLTTKVTIFFPHYSPRVKRQTEKL